MTKQERLEIANEMIRVIASCGRNFFSMQEYHRNSQSGLTQEELARISCLELDGRGRVWLINKYTTKRIYTHYKGAWRGFSDGGTLRGVIIQLREYVNHGKLLTEGVFGPWPDWYCRGDLWGYGEDMHLVREGAKRLGIISGASL